MKNHTSHDGNYINNKKSPSKKGINWATLQGSIIMNLEGLTPMQELSIQKHMDNYDVQSEIMPTSYDVDALCIMFVKDSLLVASDLIVDSGRQVNWGCVPQYVSDEISHLHKHLYHEDRGGDMATIKLHTDIKDNILNIIKTLHCESSFAMEGAGFVSELDPDPLLGSLVLSILIKNDFKCLSKFTSAYRDLEPQIISIIDNPALEQKVLAGCWKYLKTIVSDQNPKEELAALLKPIELFFHKSVLDSFVREEITALVAIDILEAALDSDLITGDFDFGGITESLELLDRLVDHLPTSPIYIATMEAITVEGVTTVDPITHTSEREECIHALTVLAVDAGAGVELVDEFDHSATYIKILSLKVIDLLMSNSLCNCGAKAYKDPFGWVINSARMSFGTSTKYLTDWVLKNIAGTYLIDFPAGTEREARDWYFEILCLALSEKSLSWVYDNKNFNKVLVLIIESKEKASWLYENPTDRSALAIVFASIIALTSESIYSAKEDDVTDVTSLIVSGDNSDRWNRWVNSLLKNRFLEGGPDELVSLYESSFYIDEYKKLIKTPIILDSYINNMEYHNKGDTGTLHSSDLIPRDKRADFEEVRRKVMLELTQQPIGWGL